MASSRPARIRAAPAFLHHEQESHHEVAALLAEFRNPVARATESSESEEESDEESGPEEGEERKESDRRPPAFAWSKEHTPVRPHAFSPPRRPVHSLTTSIPHSTSSTSSSQMNSSRSVLTTPMRTHSNASRMTRRTPPRTHTHSTGKIPPRRRSRH